MNDEMELRAARIKELARENFLRTGKPMPQDSYFDSALISWMKTLEGIPTALLKECYDEALRKSKPDDIIGAQKIKNAFATVKQSRTTSMFTPGIHHKVQLCPRCGGIFSGVIQADHDVIVSEKCDLQANPRCRPCARYLLEQHGFLDGVVLSLEQSHEIVTNLSESPTSQSVAWLEENHRRWRRTQVSGLFKELVQKYGVAV